MGCDRGNQVAAIGIRTVRIRRIGLGLFAGLCNVGTPKRVGVHGGDGENCRIGQELLMWISGVRLASYCSFADTGWIELNPAFNVFVGANNSGKTALLRAFSSTFASSPHRNLGTYRSSDVSPTMMEINVNLTVQELLDRHKVAGSQPLFPGSNYDGLRTINALLSDLRNLVQLEGSRTPGNNYQSRDNSSIAAHRSPNDQASFRVGNMDGAWRAIGPTVGVDNLLDVLNFAAEPAVFYFEPQRLNIGSVAFSDQRTLASAAGNLPNVLLYLQGSRPAIFEQIIKHVAEISQSVKTIRATPNGSNVEIILWPTDDLSRSEFSFNLSESGTGIGQIIAIITAAATNDQCTIVIDEINTFLHPSATKRLISILKSEYSQHQYIISTHSSDVIACIGAEKIHLVRKSDFSSTVETVSPSKVAGVRLVAAELGFSMMDVFGHERLIWVEGETELVAFPYLLRAADKRIPEGVGFSSVASAGDFDAKSRSVRSIVEMYEHVTKSAAPLLKGLSFGLDRESNSDEAVQKLQRSKRKLKFLPRRCVECYILDPLAIAAVLTEHDGQSHNADQVTEFIHQNGGDIKYKASSLWKGELQSEAWLKKVDAARLLLDCFAALTQNRTEYRKTRDTIKIIQYIVQRDISILQELIDFIESLVDTAMKDSKA